MTQIKIQNRDVEIKRLRLKEWTKLEPLRKSLEDAISSKDSNAIFDVMVKFVEIATTPKMEYQSLPWWEFLLLYTSAVSENSPTIEFPILRESGAKEKKLPWEYDGRSWYFWLNLFASNYGWTENIIAELDIDTAIGAYQEIEIDKQLAHEWEWGLSEIAYPYEAATKKSKYKPLPRPFWMSPIIPKQLPVVKMRRDHLPVGNVIDLQALEAERQEKKKSEG